MADEGMNKKYDEMLQREKKRSRGGLCVVIGVILFIVGWVIYPLLVIVGIALAAYGIVCLVTGGDMDEMKNFQAENVIPDVLKEKMELLNYDAKHITDTSLFQQAGIIDDVTSCHDGDYIKGKHNGVTFEYFDFDAYTESESYNSETGTSSSHEHTVFKGPALKLTMRFPVTGGDIKVEENAINLFKKKTVVHVDGGDFDRKYTTFSELDETTVKSVLTPSFIEALKKLDEFAGKKNELHAYMSGNLFLIAFKCDKNLFESIDDNLENTKQKHRSDADFIISCVDILLQSGMSFE